MNTFSIIDVDTFFETIIAGYTQFGNTAASLATEIPSLPPHIIQEKCQQLNNDRQQLSTLDDQLIDILNLAGNELLGSNNISRYRSAFSSASQAIDDIQRQLIALRQSLQDITQH